MPISQNFPRRRPIRVVVVVTVVMMMVQWTHTVVSWQARTGSSSKIRQCSNARSGTTWNNCPSKILRHHDRRHCDFRTSWRIISRSTTSSFSSSTTSLPFSNRLYSDDSRSSSVLKAASTQGIPSISLFDDDYHDESSSSSSTTAIDNVFQELIESSTSISDKKLSHLLHGLNPSQIEAVTQPVVDLRQLRRQNNDDVSFLDDNIQDIAAVSTPAGVITRVIAGPGSGKTKVLTTRIAYILQQKQMSSNGFQRNLGNVLALTFSRKAAGEMKERLDRLLGELQDLENEHEQQQQPEEEEEEDDDDAIRLDRHGNIVEEFVHGQTAKEASKVTLPQGLERVEMGTFHSICAKIMRYNGELLQDLPSVHRDMSHATPVLVKSNNNDDDEDDDDEEKTKTASSSQPAVYEIPQVNLNGQFVIADQAEQLRILKECLTECKISLKEESIKPIKILKTICDMKESFAQGIDPFLQKGDKPPGQAMQLARQVYYRYREKLLSNNAVDFDDLILMTRELLMENEDVRQRLHNRWPHVLVDEFQDSSKTQLDLVKLLTSSTLFVVGDSDQAIYTWRGAHVGSLHDVKQEFSSYGDIHTVFLKENYRSTANIVRAAERVISNNDGSGKNDDLRRSMKPIRGSGKNPRIVACDNEEAEANFVVDTILEMIEKQEIDQNKTVAIVYRTNSQSRHLEEACVAKGLPYVIRGGAGGFYNRAEIKDCLCFLRWIYNGNDVGSMLRAVKTPTKGIGDKAIDEFQRYCEVMQLYFVEKEKERKRPTPLDVLISMTNDGTNSMTKAGDFVLPSGAPLAEDHISKRALKNFLAFSSKMKDFRIQAYQKSVEELLFYIIEELDLKKHFNAISKSKSEFSDRMENVKELRQAAKKYGDTGPALAVDNPEESGLTRFLDDVALVSDLADAADEQAKNDDRLVANLLTIHASKGMEFDGVFVVGLEEGTLPCTQALQDDDGVQLEEERRLCYVAMTRAKTHLILTWRREVTLFSDWSSLGSKTVDKSRSRFLDPLIAKKKKTTSKEKDKGTGKDDGIERSARSPARLASGSVQRKRAPEHGLKRPPPKGREFSSQSIEVVRNRAARSIATYSNGVDEMTDIKRADGERRSRSERTEPILGHIPVAKKRLVKKELPENAPKRMAGNSSPSESNSRPSRRPAAPSLSSTSNTKPASQRPAPVPQKRPLPSFVDPTWFFPVGEAVLHRNLGRGVVLGHVPGEEVDETQVRVEFENGKVLEFPALGSDIVPDIGPRRR
ncbi:ATP-dependent DNA helicase PcrA [Nitzschia inconspicua]|uniref:DNA 3'-5' helicase n=1 Tax=Nitzschia inconspicua TaxID=303405 RepID=A0A9K3KZQ3_9STRA|nr:ATP-dependent DNA helicase PcrA [Nitzschia inconspicua]KAG7352141.1 ATP-dependent DNA helicase PcrA [Nitzschia inconspicua]